MIFYRITLSNGLKKVLIIFTLFFIFLLSGCVNKQIKENYSSRAIINGKKINIEIVSRASDMKRGLSNREKMCENCGMLFIMTNSSVHHFWMNEMKFPLDFVYINKGEIVETFKNIPIYTNNEYTKIIPEKNSDMVLELNAGFLDENNIEIGDQIQLINN